MSTIDKKEERHKLNFEIGARCREARVHAGYTQEQLAEAIDTSTQFLSDAERGVTGMSLLTIIKLCTTLSISSDYILFGEKENTTSSSHPFSLDSRINHLSEQERSIIEKQLNLTLQALKINKDNSI